jgi:uncharacterized membrane protein YhaH (DUF805 family)
MGFVQAISSGFSNFVSFSGRARRSAYWYWTLFATLVTGVSISIDVVFGTLLTNIVVVIATLGLCLPGLAFWMVAVAYFRHPPRGVVADFLVLYERN